MSKATNKIAKDVRVIMPAGKPKAGPSRKNYVSSMRITKGSDKAPGNVTKH